MRIDVKKIKEQNPLPPDLTAMLQKELERKRPRSIEEANRIAGQVMRRYNEAPQSDFGGLSPDQVYQLTSPDWMDVVLRLQRITYADVFEITHYHNVRHLLSTVQLLGPAKATSTGAFNRAFVGEMMKEFFMEQFVRDYNTQKSIVNQSDIPELELYRHLLPKAGLLKFEKKQYTITKFAQSLLDESEAGELYTHLFTVAFSQMNLGAMDGLPEQLAVQATVGYTLFRLLRMSDDWLNIKEISTQIILPYVQELIRRESRDRDMLESFASIRLLRHLEYFGLVEFEASKFNCLATTVRKTPLFGKFISFELA